MEEQKGYAGALITGFKHCQGDYVLTLDADMSHDPGFVPRMWRVRDQADITIASRYVRGGAAYTGFIRKTLSELLNWTLRRILSLPAQDVSSGFRLYRGEVVRAVELRSRNIEVVEEILARACSMGFSVQEVPFTYFPRGEGRSHQRVILFGFDLIRSALRWRPLRNRPDAADYEERTFYTLSPIKRLRERRRHRVTISWARGAARSLQVRCGSGIVLRSLSNAVGTDSRLPKLRFMLHHSIPLVKSSEAVLPFRSSSFDCVIFYADRAGEVPAAELARVLRSDGRLIVGFRKAKPGEEAITLPNLKIEDRDIVGGGERLALYRKKAATGELSRRAASAEPVRQTAA